MTLALGDDWQDHAVCRAAPHLWDVGGYGRPKATAEYAAETCRERCPVFAECRAWASHYSWMGVVVAGHVFDPVWPKRLPITRSA